MAVRTIQFSASDNRLTWISLLAYAGLVCLLLTTMRG
jgi:hypothetical protein